MGQKNESQRCLENPLPIIRIGKAYRYRYTEVELSVGKEGGNESLDAGVMARLRLVNKPRLAEEDLPVLFERVKQMCEGLEGGLEFDPAKIKRSIPSE